VEPEIPMICCVSSEVKLNLKIYTYIKKKATGFSPKGNVLVRRATPSKVFARNLFIDYRSFATLTIFSYIPVTSDGSRTASSITRNIIGEGGIQLQNVNLIKKNYVIIFYKRSVYIILLLIFKYKNVNL